METSANVSYLVPADQPNSIQEITRRLFPAYRIDQGTFHLAGCSLEERLFLRLRFAGQAGGRQIVLDEQGREPDAERIELLGLARTVPLQTTRQLPARELERLIQRGTRQMASRCEPGPAPTLKRVEVICCKYARGKIRFAVGEQSLDLPFAGWARHLQPPPVRCPHTGQSTFHLATTDDGRIAAAEAIRACEETGQRVLPDDLETCSVSGRVAVRERFATCPVCGEMVLQRLLVPCSSCGELVSPATLAEGHCGACRGLAPVAPDDPRLVRLRARFPALGGWTRPRLAETATVLILAAAKRLRRVLLVVDKETLDLRRLARGSRLTTPWIQAPTDQWAELLGR